MKIYRLMGILLLLEKNEKLTAKYLAEHFEVSIRTIYRDLDILSESGYPIVTESGRDGGISILGSNIPKISALDENELIKLAQKFALNSKTDILDKNITLKIREQLCESSREIFDTIQNTTLIDNSSWYGKDLINDNYLEVIQKAIIQNTCILIDYESPKEITFDRKLHPLGLCKKSNKWYLIAFCESRNDYRIFKISRIKNIAISDQKYEPHINFNISTFWENSLENFNETSTKQYIYSQTNDDPLYVVQLKLASPKLNILSGFDLLGFSKDIYEVDMISESIAFSQIIANSDITVIYPQKLVDKIISHAENILKKYQK